MMGLFDNLKSQDGNLVGLLNTTTPLYHSWWSIACIVLAHLPLGLLPHLGNKLWALKDTDQQGTFIKLAFTFGLTLGMLGLGGLLARAVVGDGLDSQNQALPMLFIELFPPWLAALVGVGILAAIMSTADGLVVSSSQIIANDLYRRTLAPWLAPNTTGDERDRQELLISRVATVVVMILCTVLAWLLIDWNVVLIVWIGIGGMMAAFAGPLVMGGLVARRDTSRRLRGADCGILGLRGTAYRIVERGLVRRGRARHRLDLTPRRRPETVLLRGDRRSGGRGDHVHRVQGNRASADRPYRRDVRKGFRVLKIIEYKINSL